jgi:anti-sigma regulatory factor (Ser/Thr protein kinase)
VRQAADSFPGESAQVRAARRFIAGVLGMDGPAVDDIILVTSELVSNAVLHSNSRLGGKVSIRAEVRPHEYVRVEVEDEGGPWAPLEPGGRRMHGLGIVSTLALTWGRDGSPETGWVVWARMPWPGP